MGWYRFYATHGPGHQSRSERYLYFEEPLSDEEQEERWDALFRHKDWPIGDTEKVDALPEKERERQIRDYRGRLEYVTEMLRVLGALPRQPAEERAGRDKP